MNDNFKKYLVGETHDVNRYTGDHMLYRFENDLGASVVRKIGTYGYEDGLYELAVIKWFDGVSESDWDLVYDTPITSDVIGWLDESDIDKLLERIKNLDKNYEPADEDEEEEVK